MITARFSVILPTGVLAVAVGLGAVGCRQADKPLQPEAAIPTSRPATAAAPTTQPFPRVLPEDVLSNAHRVTDKVISGAQPEGEKSFAALRDLGIKTIISVDGAKPDIETARKYGLTYVHLPITYSGVTESEGRTIAKAIDELPGPIYVHCHHGKHRSAAAVAVACVENGSLAPEQAESVLKTFGTGENYKGLWQAARTARPLDAKTLADTKVQYVEQAKIPPLADAMVSVDEHWDNLKAIQKAGWQTPKSHPDLDPPHEALQLEELLKEISRTNSVQARPPAFHATLLESQSAATALKEALSATPRNIPAAEAAFKRAAASCVQCHKAHRD